MADQTFQPQVNALVAKAQQFVIANDTDYTAAADELKNVSALHKEIAAYFKPLVQAAHESHKKIKAKENEALQPLDEAKRVLSQVMGKYQADLERQRREQERLLQAEQRRIEEEHRLAKAIALEEAGETEAAERKLAIPEPAPLVKIESTAPKVAGTASRTTWKFEVTDMSALPPEYKKTIPYMERIEIEVQHSKDAANIPGVRVWPETKVYARA